MRHYPAGPLWTLLAADTTCFGAGTPTFVINFRIDDFDAMPNRRRADGVTVKRADAIESGRFGWVTDPEGRRVEPRQSPASA